MSDKLQSSATLHEVTASDVSRATSTSSSRGKCFGSLFRCLKFNKKEQLKASFDNSEHKDYDYIVEKLVVKRVPFVFFKVPENISETNNYQTDSLKPQILSETKTIPSNISETQSLYYSDKLNQNTKPTGITSKLFLDANMSLLNEINKTNLTSSDYKAGIIELMNAMSSLHPDLKISERPPKDPLNIPKNKDMLSKDIEANQSMKSLSKGDGMHVQQTFMIPTIDVLDPNLIMKEKKCLRTSDIKLENDQKVYNLNHMQNTRLSESYDINDANNKNKEVHIAQPIENMFCNLPDLEKTINMNHLITEQHEHEGAKVKSETSSKLQYRQEQESFVNESKTLTENIVTSDLSPITLRWKIIIKHHKLKP
ncbi:uncharacterized protein LOC143186266 [Calliopsis andreniformis]|uniref:uncharacterized protein LOC143186266 n=1 Tax=Calliopsis andreniformis TaxID=337506 RepID=UPI003FCDF8EE